MGSSMIPSRTGWRCPSGVFQSGSQSLVTPPDLSSLKNKINIALSDVAQLVGALSSTPKGHRFNSRQGTCSGHRLDLGRAHEGGNRSMDRRFTLIQMVLSLPLSKKHLMIKLQTTH